ncbi:unnamed protein product [Didymodactylos carnosus]|uniref:Uncharacterized protein n=1 Tax=Didymodactylos carnosus TaxID=1234261 RepID=A0A815IVM9_9BILA|nr:unnamed protein product [Didymodactylos carnosus]CAF4262928.1 unnamed protein product [Didymodactylos carnosus]
MRGTKRPYDEDIIEEPCRKNEKWHSYIAEAKREFLHLKDSHHITDAGLKAMFKFYKTHKKLYSLKDTNKLRNKTNAKFPVIFTKSSAYVKLEYAVRTAIFVAQKHAADFEKQDVLTFRFNMDGTLIGNKHIVAISINCVEGGRECQRAKNLIPVGLFEVQKENTELLRKTLPQEFIGDIRSVKQIHYKHKDFDVKLKLGGDLMNAVYVFGLAGFTSNYPCVFCTQHKDDLHITEETAYDKVVTEGKGKNKVTKTIRISGTSYYDVTKLARSLEEQKHCLHNGKVNDLGYKCEPLFGDLFDFKDYVLDTLHMKLRIFDVLLKDILAHASRTEQYGAEHTKIIEEKVAILNRHAEKTVGKRFFFQIDPENQNKTITSRGKLSGHLQDLFFIDQFPFAQVLGNGAINKSAKRVVGKFKELLAEVKKDKPRCKNTLKRLSQEFIREFRQSGLRTTVTPYVHIVGNHLFQFDELEDLRAFNMQGVEKGNDVLSRLYFSSTNPAKNPLLTMMQKLFRMLEMNFQNESERIAMATFAQTGVYDFDDIDDENATLLHSESESSGVSSRRKSFDEMDSEEESETALQEDDEELGGFLSSFTPTIVRSENRFKSFKTCNK